MKLLLLLLQMRAFIRFTREYFHFEQKVVVGPMIHLARQRKLLLETFCFQLSIQFVYSLLQFRFLLLTHRVMSCLIKTRNRLVF